MTNLKRILLLWCALSGCALAVNKPSTITYTDNVGKIRIYSFTVGSTGHLVVNFYDGTNWHWADQGLPSGATSIAAFTTALTYLDTGGTQEIYAFNVSNNNHLVMNYWDAAGWHWSDQGVPAGTNIVGNPSAITFVDNTGFQRIYVFAEAGNGHMALNFRDAAGWHWSDQGVPAGSAAVFDPSVITYVDNLGYRRIYAFAEGSNEHLVVNYWNGAAWFWADQGLPSGASAVYEPSAITYLDNTGTQRIYVAVTSLNDLYLNFWDSAGWHWANQGHPSGFTQLDDPSAVTYLDSSGNQRIYISMTTNSDLFLNYWDGSTWQWANQGLISGESYVSQASTIVLANTAPWIYAVGGTDTHLVLNYWEGFFWAWSDQGTM